MVQNNFLQFLTVMVTNSPYLLVLLAGFIWSMVAMSSYPKPALLVALGIALLLGNSIVLTAVQIWGLPMISGNNSGESVRIFFQILGVVRSLVSAAGIGLLLIACFTGRSSSRIQG